MTSLLYKKNKKIKNIYVYIYILIPNDTCCLFEDEQLILLWGMLNNMMKHLSSLDIDEITYRPKVMNYMKLKLVDL